MWATLDLWQDVLRRLSSDPAELLDDSIWLGETSVEIVIEVAKIHKRKIMEKHKCFANGFASNFGPIDGLQDQNMALQKLLGLAEKGPARAHQ